MIRTRNHNLFKLLFCGRETECSGFLVVLNLRFQGRPTMCLSMASWVFGPGVCCLAPTQTPYSPIRDLQKSHTECFILMIVQNKCSVNQHFSKFVLSEISSLRTLWFYHHLCHKLKKAENWQFMYYSTKLSLAAFNGELQSLTGYLVSILKGTKRSTLLHRQDLRLFFGF